MTRRAQTVALAATASLGLFWGWLTLEHGAPATPRWRTPASAVHDTKRRGPLRERPEDPPSARASPPTHGADEPQRPHPITPLHEHMAARRAVIHALETALEERRYDAARQLIHEASELGEHDHDPSHFVSEVHGYRLILECLTARQNSGGSLPSDLLEASRLYVDAHRLAPRRQVRRVCLEGRSFGRRA